MYDKTSFLSVTALIVLIEKILQSLQSLFLTLSNQSLDILCHSSTKSGQGLHYQKVYPKLSYAIPKWRGLGFTL